MSEEKRVWGEGEDLCDPLEIIQGMGREAATGCVLDPGVRLGRWICSRGSDEDLRYAAYFSGFNEYIFIIYHTDGFLYRDGSLVLFKTWSNLFYFHTWKYKYYAS